MTDPTPAATPWCTSVASVMWSRWTAIGALEVSARANVARVMGSRLPW